MLKHFNTAGPSEADLHYLLDPLSRLDMEELAQMFAQRRYFVLHAPRQTGKTTCLLALRDYLNQAGQYLVVYANVEVAQAARGDAILATQAMVSVLRGQFAKHGVSVSRFVEAGLDELRLVLASASEQANKPTILLLDEVDSLVGDSLISLLRQIRAGYPDRPKSFPHAMVLCGIRDVRDYRMTLSGGEVITGGSAFNIKSESLRLGDFTFAEMTSLYAQHTKACGQRFDDAAMQRVWQLTQGQPWLVNALGEQLVWRTKENRDRTKVLGLDQVNAAAEALILRNDTHLDQLADKLRETRVRAILEPMLLGLNSQPKEDDRQYLLDLGLVRSQDGQLRPANAIYAEILPRVLTVNLQDNLHAESILPNWRDQYGRLNPDQLMRNFFSFWRKDGEPLMQSAPYHEAAPHLVLMAYLHRVVNGAGQIEREYALGSGRLDLWVRYGSVQMAIEVKVWRDARPDPLIDGLQQIDRYLTRLGLATGFLVIFDQRSSAPAFDLRTEESQAQTASGKNITVWRG